MIHFRETGVGPHVHPAVHRQRILQVAGRRQLSGSATNR